MTVSVEVSVPDRAATLALFGAVVAIDLVALRLKRSTVSRWVRHQVHAHPVAAGAVAAALGLHLVLDVQGDPLRWAAGRWAAGWAARQTGAQR